MVLRFLLFGLGAQARIIGLRHDRQPLRCNVRNHLGACLKSVQPAIIFRHQIDLGRICGRCLASIGNGLCAGCGLIVGQPVAAHRAACVHQRIKRDAVAGRHAVVVEIMRAGNLDRTGPECRVRVFIGDDRNHPAVFFWPNRNLA